MSIETELQMIVASMLYAEKYGVGGKITPYQQEVLHLFYSRGGRSINNYKLKICDTWGCYYKLNDILLFPDGVQTHAEWFRDKMREKQS